MAYRWIGLGLAALALAAPAPAISQKPWAPSAEPTVELSGKTFRVRIHEDERYFKDEHRPDGTRYDDGYFAVLRLDAPGEVLAADYSQVAQTHNLFFEVGDGYLARTGVDKCAMAQAVYARLLAKVGLQPSTPVDCGKFYLIPSGRGPVLNFDGQSPTRLAPTTQVCAGPESLAGTWTDTRPASQAIEPGGVRLTVAQKDGQWRGDRAAGSGKYVYAPRSVTGIAVSKVASKEAGICAYDATCLTDGGSPQQCRIKLDAKADTIRFSIADVDAYGGAAWSRSAAPPPSAAATCQPADLDGNWSRADGARVTVSGAGAGFKDGANALIYGHPDGWPPGVFKFSGIKPAGACRWTAQCTTVFHDPAGKDGYRVETEACTLTVDPKARTLTASGTHGAYHR